MLRRNSLQWLGVILVSLIFFNACVPIQREPASDAATEAATETTVEAEAGGDEEPPERGAVAGEVDLTKRLTCAELQVGQAYAVGESNDSQSDPNTWTWKKMTLKDKNECDSKSLVYFEGAFGNYSTDAFWVRTTDAVTGAGIVLLEATAQDAAASAQNNPAPVQNTAPANAPSELAAAVCSDYQLNQFYAVWFNNEWWKAEHDKCLDGNDPQFKIEGYSWVDHRKTSEIKTLEQASAEGIVPKTTPQQDAAASKQSSTAPAQAAAQANAPSQPTAAVCSNYTLNQFYAVKFNNEWWQAEYDKCLAGDDPQFKIEGVTWVYKLMNSAIKTLDQAKAEGLTLRKVEKKDLTCAGQELANITPKAPPLSQAEKDAIVNAHNQERQMADVTGKVVWDDNLAAFAMGWDEAMNGHYTRGVVPPIPAWPHSPESCYAKSYFSQYMPDWRGENIGTVQGFISEKADYNLSTKSCSPGKVCGHYTNMINPDVTKIGCSRDGGVCEYAH